MQIILPPRSHRYGYTFVEVMIVVLLLGIMATLALPAVADFEERADQAAFASDILTYARAANLFMLETGELLEDSGSGFFPDGFEDYVDSRQWTDGTPIGGVWDVEQNSFGSTSSLGVHFYKPRINGAAKSDAYMLTIDQQIDNGNLATGRFRKIDKDRYYFILKN